VLLLVSENEIHNCEFLISLATQFWVENWASIATGREEGRIGAAAEEEEDKKD
jgi:hypothetical protein